MSRRQPGLTGPDRIDRSEPDPLLLNIRMIIVKDLEKNLLFLHTAMPEEKGTFDKEHFKNQYQESEWTKEEKEIELIRSTCQMKGIVLSNFNIGFKKHCFPARCMPQEGFWTF